MNSPRKSIEHPSLLEDIEEVFSALNPDEEEFIKNGIMTLLIVLSDLENITPKIDNHIKFPEPTGKEEQINWNTLINLINRGILEEKINKNDFLKILVGLIDVTWATNSSRTFSQSVSNLVHGIYQNTSPTS